MAKSKNTDKKPADTGKAPEPDKGYSGSDDYTSGRIPSSDTGVATDAQLREDRERQRERDAQ
jgi:hypothetical protein